MRLGVRERERDAERGVTERRGEPDWTGEAERVRDRPRDPEGERDGIARAIEGNARVCGFGKVKGGGGVVELRRRACGKLWSW